MSRRSTTLSLAVSAGVLGVGLLAAPVASADPTPGYPGGYPGGGYGGGTAGGGIDTTNPGPGGGFTVTAACSGSGDATLTWGGTTLTTAPVSDGRAVLRGTVPAGATGTAQVVATCPDGAVTRYSVTVAAADPDNGGVLASTGARIATISLAGVALVGVGFGIVLLARRRRTVA